MMTPSPRETREIVTDEEEKDETSDDSDNSNEGQKKLRGRVAWQE
jgi:hypothetical protein